MSYYKGYQLVHYVVLSPPCISGVRGVSVRDDLMGVLFDCQTIEEAKYWIDGQIQTANKMLEKILR